MSQEIVEALEAVKREIKSQYGCVGADRASKIIDKAIERRHRYWGNRIVIPEDGSYSGTRVIPHKWSLDLYYGPRFEICCCYSLQQATQLRDIINEWLRRVEE